MAWFERLLSSFGERRSVAYAQRMREAVVIFGKVVLKAVSKVTVGVRAGAVASAEPEPAGQIKK